MFLGRKRTPIVVTLAMKFFWSWIFKIVNHCCIIASCQIECDPTWQCYVIMMGLLYFYLRTRINIIVAWKLHRILAGWIKGTICSVKTSNIVGNPWSLDNRCKVQILAEIYLDLIENWWISSMVALISLCHWKKITNTIFKPLTKK